VPLPLPSLLPLLLLMLLLRRRAEARFLGAGPPARDRRV
jgi:hypothetical protein